MDRYAYANSSPANYIDVSGHEAGSMYDRGYTQNPNPNYVSTVALQVTPLKQLTNTSCGESAFTMAYNYSYEPDTTEQEVINTAEGNGWYTRSDLPFTSPAQMASIANNQTNGYFTTGQVTNADEGMKLLMAQIQSGNPVIIDYRTDPTQPENITGSDAHFVVVTGFTIDSSKLYITYNDPWTGKPTTMPWDTFQNAWLKNHDTNDTGNGWWMVVPRQPTTTSSKYDDPHHDI